MTKTILFVLTGHGDLGDTGARTGVWLEELAAPYQLFDGAGFDILLGTPEGKRAPLDPASLEEPWLLPAGHWLLGRQDVIAALETPLDLAGVDPARIDAIFLVGGTGTLWDFPTSTALGGLVSVLHATGKPVAAICHGVVGLMTAKAADGGPLVAGREITCFSNEEEALLGYEKIVPLLAETALVEQGARYTCALPFEPQVVEDGNLLTGQNPASALPLATAILQRLR